MNIHTMMKAQPELTTPTSCAQRRIAIAVDLSDESAFAVKWAVNNYLRPGDTVILLHVRPTSILYGADWGATAPEPQNLEHKQQVEDSFDNLTSLKAAELAQPLVEADVPYKLHIVKDHDLKERLCLEVERLGLSAVIMGSRGFGAAKKSGKGRLGSVSDYCVQHCVCPVVVVRYSEGDDDGAAFSGGKAAKVMAEEVLLHPVPEEDLEFRDDDEQVYIDFKNTGSEDLNSSPVLDPLRWGIGDDHSPIGYYSIFYQKYMSMTTKMVYKNEIAKTEEGAVVRSQIDKKVQRVTGGDTEKPGTKGNGR